MRRARAVAVKPCVDAARGDRQDGAASAVVPEPKRALRRRAARAVTATATTDENRRAEGAAAGRRSNVGRPPGRGMRRARAVAVRPCVDAERDDRRDGAASAVVPEPSEPKCDLRRRTARSVTAEDATDENRRAEIVAAERRSNVGRPERGVRCAHAAAVRPCVALAL